MIQKSFIYSKVEYFILHYQTTQFIYLIDFPISSIDKYIKTFTNENVNFKIIDTSSNKIYLPQDFILNSDISNIINKILSVDTKQLSISEAYQFIEDLKEQAEKLNI